MLRAIIIAALALALVAHAASVDYSKNPFRVHGAERMVSLATARAFHRTHYQVSNNAESSVFYLAVENPERLALVRALARTGAQTVTRDDEDHTTEEVDVYEELVVSFVESRPKQNVDVYSVRFIKRLSAGEMFEFDVDLYYTGVLEPLPKKVKQSDPQKLLYHTNAYIPSVYAITEQSTQFLLGSPSSPMQQPRYFESYTKLPNGKSHANTDGTLNYGSFNNIRAYEREPIQLHYFYPRGLLVAPKVDREIELSHWDNVFIRENVHLQNNGAELEGSFSRLNYMHGAIGNAVSEIEQILPPGAHDPYYRDVIGNISSSHFSHHPSGGMRFEFQPRFLLFGSWKTEYLLGYSLPASLYLTVEKENSNRHALILPVSSEFDDIHIEHLELTFLLPEGSQNIEFQCDQVDFQVEEVITTRQAYLDTTGRLVYKVHLHNIISEHSKVLFSLHYDFSASNLLHEPLLLIFGYFAAFFSLILYSRLDFSVTLDENDSTGNDPHKLLVQVKRAYDNASRTFDQYDQALERFQRDHKQHAYDMQQANLQQVAQHCAGVLRTCADSLSRIDQQRLAADVRLLQRSVSERVELASNNHESVLGNQNNIKEKKQLSFNVTKAETIVARLKVDQ